MEEIDGLEVDLDRLPAELRDLAPLIRRWAVIDDEERDTRLEQAQTRDLANLWLSVSPRFPAIEEYLEKAEGKATNEAIVLGATAEAAVEAGEIIERRTGGPPD